MRWPKATLGKCATLVNGRAYKQEELLDSGTPALRIQNLNGGDRWYYSDLSLPIDKYCDKGDLLFAWWASFGPYLRNGPRAIYHYHIWKVMPGRLLDKGFLYCLLGFLTDRVKSESHGAPMLHMTKARMEALEIPLPPLEEQRRIAAILDKESAIRSCSEKAARKVADIKASLFDESFIAHDRHDHWEQLALGDLCDVQGGLQMTSARSAMPIRVPYLRVANVLRAGLTWPRSKKSAAASQNLKGHGFNLRIFS